MSAELLKKYVGLYDKLDVLVNNAGISLVRVLQETSQSEWDKLFAVNVKGTFLCCRAVADRMIGNGGGCIINISSVWGEVGASCEVAYSATKGAVIAFTKALSKELAPSKVRVNCVSPGVIDTEMNSHLTGEEIELLDYVAISALNAYNEIQERRKHKAS